MIRRIRSLAPLPLLATGALVAVSFLFPGRVELAVHGYLLVLASLALGFLVGVLRRTHPVAATSPFDLGLRVRSRANLVLPELARLEREVTLSTSTAFDVHVRLRPVLRRIATRALANRRGVDLERSPATAQALLGEGLWELVRPDREPPHDRGAPGLELSSLRAMVDTLEAL
ncbi:MAG: hypothetical protein MSC30_12285 [Gaiellaceae bacterium MAG52_C11]|nr:hypothetical protein [Candidatus Gaiellasilicea maunaloa]